MLECYYEKCAEIFILWFAAKWNRITVSQVIEMAQEQFSHSWMEKWTNQVPENGHKNVTSMS